MCSVSGAVKPGPEETLGVVTKTTGLRRNLPIAYQCVDRST